MVRSDVNPLLVIDSIRKGFGGVPVLRGVSLSIAPGRTLGLVGENGAGKSTLMNILGGNLRPDSGHMEWAGRPYLPASPSDASAAGIAFIHQELNLFPNLSIADNLFLTRFPVRGRLPWIDRPRLHAAAAGLLDQVGLAVHPGTAVGQLSAGERQLVEIARALRLEPRLLILDEPTTSLGTRETRHLFALLGRLRARGMAMIYISHHLGDVLQLADEVVVLRDGEQVGAGPRAEFDAGRLIRLMVGRELNQLFPVRKARPLGSNPVSPALEVLGLTQPGVVRGIEFRVAGGEVVGLAGLMGAGRSELARILFGLDRAEQGRVRVAGQEVTAMSVAGRIRHGLAFLTEDRRDDGLCLEASIADSIALVTLRQHVRVPGGGLALAGLRTAVNQVRAAVHLTPSARNEQPVRTLSGGNQQKVVLAKWLLAAPRMLILDEPTRGIDVGAKFEIYQLIHQLAAAGAGVLLISSEIEELTGLCDRLLVMRRGELVDELAREEFDRERILRAALHETEAA